LAVGFFDADFLAAAFLMVVFFFRTFLPPCSRWTLTYGSGGREVESYSSPHSAKSRKNARGSSSR
jgi:hypothetical protein